MTSAPRPGGATHPVDILLRRYIGRDENSSFGAEIFAKLKKMFLLLSLNNDNFGYTSLGTTWAEELLLIPTLNPAFRRLGGGLALLAYRERLTLGSSGGSYWTIQSTSGMSSPLAATSVQMRVPDDA